MKKRILYANANYEEIVAKNGYFVDKTKFIEKLEQIENPIFLRPRRFGKSLWCRLLECYYNIGQKDDFERLFGHTWIGRNPSRFRNSFFVLHLDFSVVDPAGSAEEIEKNFNFSCNLKMKTMLGLSEPWFRREIEIDMNRGASANLQAISDHIREKRLPKLFDLCGYNSSIC